MESHTTTPFIDKKSHEILTKEDVRTETQSLLLNLDPVQQNNQGESNNVTKVFVGGLPGDLTTEEFKAYFEQFGTIEDVVLMFDKPTNRPRGFGFVTFDSAEAANTVLKNRFYELKNKRVEVKKAVSKQRMSRSFGNSYDAMYNFGWYYYGMNNSAYWAYNGLGYYPYHGLYQSWYDFTNTYSYQTSYNYGNTPYSSKPFYTYMNTTPIVVKKNTNVKDGDDSEVAKQNASSFLDKGETEIAHLRPGESNDEESVVKDVLVNGEGEGLNLYCNGEIGAGYAEASIALSLYSDGSEKQMGADGQPLCTADS